MKSDIKLMPRTKSVEKLNAFTCADTAWLVVAGASFCCRYADFNSFTPK